MQTPEQLFRRPFQQTPTSSAEENISTEKRGHFRNNIGQMPHSVARRQQNLYGHVANEKRVSIFKTTIQSRQPFWLLGRPENLRPVSVPQSINTTRMIRMMMGQKNQIQPPLTQNIHDWSGLSWVHDSARPIPCRQKPDIIV